MITHFIRCQSGVVIEARTLEVLVRISKNVFYIIFCKRILKFSVKHLEKKLSKVSKNYKKQK